MPQYDNYGILEDRCYDLALDAGAYHGSCAEDWLKYLGDELRHVREDIRNTLLIEFPDIDGPLIAELMDEALTELSFPFDRLP